MWIKAAFHASRRELAKHWIKLFPSIDIIGITGSVGKTTTKEAVALVLAQKFNVVKSEANLDPVFNIPITLLKVKPSTQKVVLEMGVEYPGEMAFYLSMVQPSLGVITTINWTHTQFFGDINGVKKEKEQLITSLPKSGYAVLNWDNEITRNMAKDSDAKVFYYGSSREDCHLWYDQVDLSIKHTKLCLHYKQESVEVKYPLLGRHQLTSALAAASVGILNGLNLLTIRRGLMEMVPSPHRFSVVEGPNRSVIIDDTYNASPVAVKAALQTVSELPAKRRIAILGEMKELGGYNEEGHRLIGNEVAKLNFDILITYGECAQLIGKEVSKHLDGRGKGTEVIPMNDIRTILDWITNNAKDKDMILIKGSRHHIHLERLIAGIKNEQMTINCAFCPEFATVGA